MVTDMEEADVRLTGARKADSIQAAVDLCLRELASNGVQNPSICTMPSASYTVPQP